MQRESRPHVGVGVIILKDGKVLMQHRAGSHGAGTWSFPGGHLEFGEEPEDCAKREAMEELGVTLKTFGVDHTPTTSTLRTDGMA